MPAACEPLSPSSSHDGVGNAIRFGMLSGGRLRTRGKGWEEIILYYCQQGLCPAAACVDTPAIPRAVRQSPKQELRQNGGQQEPVAIFVAGCRSSRLFEFITATTKLGSLPGMC